MDTQKIFLAPKFPLVDGDHAVFSPVWLIPTEIFSQGMLKKSTYSYRTVVLDAMTGNPIVVFDGLLPWPEMQESPDVRSLNPAIDKTRASFLAERSIENSGVRGWRSIGSFSSVHVDQEKLKLRWRLVILREGVALDALTGQPLTGSELLTALLSETTKNKKGGS